MYLQDSNFNFINFNKQHHSSVKIDDVNDYLNEIRRFVAHQIRLSNNGNFLMLSRKCDRLRSNLRIVINRIISDKPFIISNFNRVDIIKLKRIVNAFVKKANEIDLCKERKINLELQRTIDSFFNEILNLPKYKTPKVSSNSTGISKGIGIKHYPLNVSQTQEVEMTDEEYNKRFEDMLSDPSLEYIGGGCFKKKDAQVNCIKAPCSMIKGGNQCLKYTDYIRNYDIENYQKGDNVTDENVDETGTDDTLDTGNTSLKTTNNITEKQKNDNSKVIITIVIIGLAIAGYLYFNKK